MNNKRILCQVVRVDERATQCQKVGNACFVDETNEGKLCSKVWPLIQDAVSRLKAAAGAGGSLVGGTDVPCPDDHVLYRLSFADENTSNAGELHP